MASRSDEPRNPPADSLFAAWLARHEAGDESDFEALCRNNPHAAAEMRDLYGHWAKVEAVRLQHSLGGSLSEKLKTQYGSGVDPQVTLEGGGEDPGDFSSEVLSRLADRGSASKRYKLQGEITHGGMGAILRAWDEDLRRHLAMKVILGQVREDVSGGTPPVDRRVLARFLEEAQVTGQLEHPGIVPVHELGLDAQGRVFFTMKLVEGRTFGEVLELAREGRESWTQTRALGVIQKVCDAMAYAHSRGVVHRDLKPANVMVGRFGEVYVMDWGLAKVLGRGEADQRLVESEREAARELDPASSLHTLEGEVMGTPAYMPPEQAMGRIDEIGPRSDMYALGAMLYHLLAGHQPYVEPGTRPNGFAIWAKVKAGPPAPLSREAPEAPAELVAICERAMARGEAARYPDMAALAKDLAAYVEGRVVSAYETGAWAEARKWVQRNKPLAASLAAAVVLLVAGLMVSLTQKARADANAKEAARNAQEAQQNLVLAQKNEQEAKDNLTLALRNEAEAKAQQLRAEAETAKVLRLSDVKVLEQLVAEADLLWPAHPEKIAELESWLDRARVLAASLPSHRATLAEMRGRANPWSDKERANDRRTHPRAGELAEKQVELAGLIAQLEQGLPGEGQATADKRVAELEPEVAALSEEVESRRTWSFDSPEDQWQHDVLAELIGNLEGLDAGLLAEDMITADHGWSLPKRLAFAQELEAGFSEGGEYAEAWAAARLAIREAYPGLGLQPQMGLLPIGPDPSSGLWEFAHLMTGMPPERGLGGKLILTEETGLVLVLLRGGSYWMGAQNSEPNGRNYDPQAQSDEGPVHEVELSAFFLSKYELTQGQCVRLTGRNPSIYGPHNWGAEWLSTARTASLRQPVERLSWLDCMAWLPRAGLELPSEAQWEYGARGGTATAWWTGAEKESLAGAANLNDNYAQGNGGSRWVGFESWLDDGATAHAPVGMYASNAFGLHDVAGNLWEWCLDGYDSRFYGESTGVDPVSPWEGAASRVDRGGSFDLAARIARSAYRDDNTPSDADLNLGVRPARAIDP